LQDHSGKTMLEMVGTGDPPVPVGDPPTGPAKHNPVKSRAILAGCRSAEWPQKGAKSAARQTRNQKGDGRDGRWQEL
jgi:hypothetical protein